jgi:opacity protein-like surface antigen
MKNKLLLASIVLALPAFAGTPVMPAPAPAPEPGLWTWFAGASAGYLFDSEEMMYNAHVGVDTPWNIAGCNISLFAEVGYTQDDENAPPVYYSPNFVPVKLETEIVPVTANIKFERQLAGGLNAYLGAGLGYAAVDVTSRSASPWSNYSDQDCVFAAQVFAGLNYEFCPSFEMYSGARWIYIDDAKILGADYKIGDDWLVELGARFNF